MSSLLSALFLALPAAVAAAIVYLPVFLLLKKRRADMPLVRHAANYAFAGYCIALVYVVFLLYNGMGGEGEVYRHANLAPFTEVAKQYMFGQANIEGLFMSQYMLNMIMFIPLGFLLPIVFPRAMGSFPKTAAAALAATVLIEAVQYLIGRSADIDDVIANFIGGAAGYGLFTLCRAALCRTKLWQRLLPENAACPKAAYIALSALILLAVLAGPSIMDAADSSAPYGIFRYNSQSIPTGAKLETRLSSVDPPDGTVYSIATVDKHALLDTICAQLCPDIEMDSYTWHSDYYGEGLTASDESGERNISIYGSGMFNASMPDENGQLSALDDAAFTAYAKGLAEAFLLEGESADNGRMEKFDGMRALSFQFFGGADQLARGKMTIYTRDGILRIDSDLTRYAPSASAPLINPAEAYAASHGIGAFTNSECKDFEITDIALTVAEIRGQLLPAYEISGSALYPNGERLPILCVVDAIRR